MVSLTANSPKIPLPWRPMSRNNATSVSRNLGPVRYSTGKWKSKWQWTMSVWALHSRHHTHVKPPSTPRRSSHL